MPKKFDDIQLKIQPAGTLLLSWRDVDRAVILINGQDMLDIVLREQEKLGHEQKFNYHQIRPSELYGYLVESEKSNGKEEAAILCCTCDEVGCGAVVTNVIKTQDKVTWKNVRDRDRTDYFDLTFSFDPKEYENFMSQLQKAGAEEKREQ
ncbi:MAG: hypothetical protein J5601_00675 [Elusimicrobiaceae bacterium]|nr:hypothetical protein [Elusimicrobiaceae bacterium]